MTPANNDSGRRRGRLPAKIARWCDKLAKPWRGEIALVEASPSLMAGFALTTGSLLAGLARWCPAPA